MKIDIDYHPTTEDTWAYLAFKQEGMRGYLLAIDLVPEFLEALDNDEDEIFYFWQNYGIHNTKKGCDLYISTSDVPLLSLSDEQRARLISYLSEKYI